MKDKDISEVTFYEYLTGRGVRFIKKEIEELEETKRALIEMQCKLKEHPIDEYITKKIEKIQIKIENKEHLRRKNLK